MLNSLADIEPKIAAAILAQTALDLSDGMYVKKSNLLPNQKEVEERVLAELRGRLSLSNIDSSSNALSKLVDALDEEGNKLVSSEISESYLNKLGNEGLLPSDLYTTFWNPAFASRYGKHWSIEKNLAEKTITRPDIEESHDSFTGNDFALITIFAKFFDHKKYPAKSFWVVVAGQRKGQKLDVVNIFRAYPSHIDLKECKSLLDVLRVISEKFGFPIEIDGEKNTFFFSASKNSFAKANKALQSMLNKEFCVTLTNFEQGNSDKCVGIIISIDMKKYLEFIKSVNGWETSLLR